jgi:hypothetical protein
LMKRTARQWPSLCFDPAIELLWLICQICQEGFAWLEKCWC